MRAQSRIGCLLVASLLASRSQAQDSRPTTAPLTEDRNSGAAAIEPDFLRSSVHFLTEPAQEGRATGSEGFRRAAAFVAEHFEKLGLEPLGDLTEGGTRSWFQKLPWTIEHPSPECGLGFQVGGKDLASWPAPTGLRGKVQRDQTWTGPVVLLVVHDPDGAGIARLSLEGKLALVWLSDSGLGPASERGGAAQAARRFSIVNELTAAKAAAHVIVDDVEFAAIGGLIGSVQPGTGSGASRAERARLRVPNALTTARAQVRELLAACGVDPGVLASGSLEVPLPNLTAKLSIHTEVAQAPAWNVVARLRGKHPQRAAEHVVLGSHLDHLGIQQGVLYPGADDDASGTAGVLAVSRAFARNPTRPSRSIVFVTFCGEELGLLGSAFFVQNSPIPLSSIVAEIQMDMIGRNEENANEPASANLNSLHLIGTRKLSHDLHQLCVLRNLRHAGFDLEWDEEDVFFRSDHANFARQGIPIAFLFTGFHPDYHRPSDLPERIGYEKLARVARYAFDIAFELAEATDRPLVDPGLWETTRKGFVGEGTPVDPAAPVRVTGGR